mmetsp:Transcript_43488/g.68088  ORF Transcript_43488/g.68088 Transcript_43488/m.68088 type:complete len:223 (-) Transcript_43488:234-902(-)
MHRSPAKSRRELDQGHWRHPKKSFQLPDFLLPWQQATSSLVSREHSCSWFSHEHPQRFLLGIPFHCAASDMILNSVKMAWLARESGTVCGETGPPLQNDSASWLVLHSVSVWRSWRLYIVLHPSCQCHLLAQAWANSERASEEPWIPLRHLVFPLAPSAEQDYYANWLGAGAPAPVSVRSLCLLLCTFRRHRHLLRNRSSLQSAAGTSSVRCPDPRGRWSLR